MVEIETRGQRLTVPGCIDELTPLLYRRYLWLAMQLRAGLISLECFGVRWLSALIGMVGADYTILKPEHVEELRQQQDRALSGFLSDTGEPLLETCRNLSPVFGQHQGPGDWLSGMTFGEVVECSTVFAAIAEDPTAAEHVARVMYHIPEGEAVDALLCQHAVLLFSSVWRAIQTGPVEINGRMLDLSIIFRSSGRDRRPDDRTGWTGVTFEVAQAGLFGTVSQVEAADFWAVLLYLYKCKFEYDHEQKTKNDSYETF